MYTKKSDILKSVCDLASEKKARDIVVLDLRGLTTFTDYLVIMTVDSAQQAQTVMKLIEEELKRKGRRPLHIEGAPLVRWILMDYSNIVINIFLEEARNFWRLERLWADAKKVNV